MRESVYESILGTLYDNVSRNLLNPKDLHIWLTNRCNLKCYFCPVVTHSAEPRTDLRVDFVEDFLDKVSNIFPEVKTVHFSGGEPLLHDKFDEILENTKSRGYKIELCTNGILLKRLEDVGLLEEIDLICVSLHSIDSYEQVFGTSNPKFGEQVLTCLGSLKPNVKKRTNLSVALTNVNKDLNDVIEFARSYGFKMRLFPIRNLPHAYTLTHGICEDKINPRILEIINANKDIILWPCSHILQKLMALQAKSFTWSRRCSVPFVTLILDYWGNLRLCCGDQPVIGKAMDIPKILENQVSRRIMFEANHRLGVCKSCFVGTYPCFKCVKVSQVVDFVKEKIA